MTHGIYRVETYEVLGPYRLRLTFDDGIVREIDFLPMLAGELYSPLLDLEFFNKVELETDFGTLVWPNGADFDPETLHDWPELADELAQRARRWESEETNRETQ